MSPERLSEIRKRLDAATPGPWRFVGDGRYFEEPGTGEILADVGYCCVTDDYTIQIADPDAELIANAPTDIADLLAEVERLREAYSKMRDAAKVYYTISKNETYIREEDLPPVFHKLPEPSND